MIEINKIPDDVIQLIKDFQCKEYEAYLVGGCVRDLIMNKNPHDYDICTSAKPEEIIEVFNTFGYSYYTVGIEFGTVTAIINGNEYEVTTYRLETGYKDSRHPSKVEFTNDINKDLNRRDFTINAIAFDPVNNIIIDMFDGQKDIENAILRTVGNPNDRFNEDALRILRAVRFSVKYNFDIEQNTFNAMISNKEGLGLISKERITDELSKILTCGKDCRHWFLRYNEIIFEIIPELKACYKFNQNNKYHKHDIYEHILAVVDNCKTDKFEIKLAALLHDIGKPKAYVVDENGHGHFYGHPKISKDIAVEVFKNDLRLTNEQKNRVLELIEFHDMELVNTPRSVKRALNNHGEDWLMDWFILKQADMDDHIYPDKNCKLLIDIQGIKETINDMFRENTCFKLNDLKINGSDIMTQLGIKPGKQVGMILNTLFNEVLDDKLDNNEESLMNRAIEIYKQV